MLWWGLCCRASQGGTVQCGGLRAPRARLPRRFSSSGIFGRPPGACCRPPRSCSRRLSLPLSSFSTSPSPHSLSSHSAQLFAIIVFGVLADNGKVDGYSVYDGKDAPLHFTIGIGVSAFIIALLLLSLLIANEVSSALVSVQVWDEAWMQREEHWKLQLLRRRPLTPACLQIPPAIPGVQRPCPVVAVDAAVVHRLLLDRRCCALCAPLFSVSSYLP